MLFRYQFRNIKVLKKFWIDPEVLQRPNLCTHMSLRNEIEGGVEACVVCRDNDETAWILFATFAAGVLWTLGLLWLTGRLNAY